VARSDPHWIIYHQNQDILADHGIAFKTITIGRDFGTTVEITAGRTSDDLLVDNPSMVLVEGAKVAAEGMEGNTQPSHERISLETKKVVGTALNSVPRQSDKKKY
jgi:hypothetical protein